MLPRALQLHEAVQITNPTQRYHVDSLNDENGLAGELVNPQEGKEYCPERSNMTIQPTELGRQNSTLTAISSCRNQHQHPNPVQLSKNAASRIRYSDDACKSRERL